MPPTKQRLRMRSCVTTLCVGLLALASCDRRASTTHPGNSSASGLGPEEPAAPRDVRGARMQHANAPVETATATPTAVAAPPVMQPLAPVPDPSPRSAELPARMPARPSFAARRAPLAERARGGADFGDGFLARPTAPPPPPGGPAGFYRPAAQGQVLGASGGGGSTGHGAGFATGLDATSVVTIDPNGRFATTYRPGHGHLAGFEASLARGEIPADARELVGDVGSRYAPTMPAPADRALAWRIDMARAALPPTGGHTHLRIALRSSERAATARPPMSVHVVLDVSNSMAGDSIVNARRAAQDLVGRLEPGDHFSLVAFGGTASVRVPEGPVGPRRQQILDTIAGLQLEGGTNISEGLNLGYAEVARGPQAPEWVRLVMLLSDGHPNAGETRAEAIAGMAARAFQTGVQTSAFGLGDDYDANLMSGIAEQGAGGYYYVHDPQGIAASLGIELESRLQPVAQGVEIRVRLRPDVRLTQTYGSRRLDVNEAAAVRAQEVAVDDQVARRDRIARDRQSDVEGGMRFFIPGFARDDQHVILLGIDLPAGTGARPVATVEFRYKDRLTRRNVTDEQPVRVQYADSDAASAATADASVQRTVQGFDAGETLGRAARMVGGGDNTGASTVLAERIALLRAASEALHEPRLAEDAARLDRLRNLVGGTGPLSQSLVLAMLLNTSSQGMLH